MIRMFCFFFSCSFAIDGCCMLLILGVVFRFHSFFASLDSVRTTDLLYLSSKGISAAKREGGEEKEENGKRLATGVSEDEEEGAEEQES